MGNMTEDCRSTKEILAAFRTRWHFSKNCELRWMSETFGKSPLSQVISRMMRPYIKWESNGPAFRSLSDFLDIRWNIRRADGMFYVRQPSPWKRSNSRLLNFYLNWTSLWKTWQNDNSKYGWLQGRTFGFRQLRGHRWCSCRFCCCLYSRSLSLIM